MSEPGAGCGEADELHFPVGRAPRGFGDAGDAGAPGEGAAGLCPNPLRKGRSLRRITRCAPAGGEAQQDLETARAPRSIRTSCRKPIGGLGIEAQPPGRRVEGVQQKVEDKGHPVAWPLQTIGVPIGC